MLQIQFSEDWLRLIQREWVGANISSGLTPWIQRSDFYDEEQRIWALSLVRDHASYIRNVAEYYGVTPDAIAGVILWEALENPYPRVRGFGSLTFTRPGARRSAFGIPGKIHVDNDNIAARFDTTVVSRIAAWNPSPPSSLLDLSLTGLDPREFGAALIDRRIDRLLYDPRVALEYIGAILNDHAQDYANVFASVGSSINIRDQAGVLGVLYQGGIDDDRRRDIRNRLTNADEQDDPPQLPETEKMGTWISQYRWWINEYLAAFGGTSPMFSEPGDIPVPSEYDQRGYGGITPPWRIW